MAGWLNGKWMKLFRDKRIVKMASGQNVKLTI